MSSRKGDIKKLGRCVEARRPSATRRKVRIMSETTEEKVQKAKDAEKRIEGVLEKHGFNGFWAKLVASVIIAALAVAVGMFTTQCTMSYTKLPDGTVRARGNVVLPQKVNTVTK